MHRHRLRREDLEDSYSQAALELISQAQRGATFASRVHIGNALELRFLSRVRDRRRALGGRSPMLAALEEASSLADAGEARIEIVDARAAVERSVLLRDELREIRRAAESLTVDQRLVLGSQLADISCAAFCSRFGWSREKYRKVAQRARLRLRQLVTSGDRSVPQRRRMSEEMAGLAYDDHPHHS